MFELLIDRIEAAVDDPQTLAKLRDRVATATGVTDAERERLLGLIDRYQDDLRLEAEAAETALVLAELFGETDGLLLESPWVEDDHPRDAEGQWIHRFDSFAEVREAIEPMASDWLAGLSKAERRSLQLYKDDAKRRYQVINDALRARAQGQPITNALVLREVPRIDAALRRAALARPVVAHRAVGPDVMVPEEGGEFVEDGFASMALLTGTADRYAVALGPNPTVIRTRLFQGTPFGWLDTIGELAEDGEILLPPGAVFRVHSKHVRGGTLRVEATVEAFRPADARGASR